MGRPPTPADVVQQVASIWIGNPSLTAKEVYVRATRIDGCPKLRKVQEIVRETRKRAEIRGIPLEDPQVIPWRPEWPTDPGDIACMFRVLAVATVRGHRLNSRTARWALKLRNIFEGKWEGSIMHLAFAYLYGECEKEAALLPGGSNSFPGHSMRLNELIMLRFWEREEAMTVLKEMWVDQDPSLRKIWIEPREADHPLVPNICQNFLDLLDLQYSSRRPTGLATFDDRYEYELPYILVRPIYDSAEDDGRTPLTMQR